MFSTFYESKLKFLWVVKTFYKMLIKHADPYFLLNMNEMIRLQDVNTWQTFLTEFWIKYEASLLSAHITLHFTKSEATFLEVKLLQRKNKNKLIKCLATGPRKRLRKSENSSLMRFLQEKGSRMSNSCPTWTMSSIRTKHCMQEKLELTGEIPKTNGIYYKKRSKGKQLNWLKKITKFFFQMRFHKEEPQSIGARKEMREIVKRDPLCCMAKHRSGGL